MNEGPSADAVDVFERARPRLRGIAYRMLGVVADADDVVQEAWIRWDGADRDTIGNADAWLNTVATRLALDRLRQRKRAEEAYVGPWLPEPLVSDRNSPEAAAELADSLTLGFLTMLETLTPDERAVVLLADVFGERFRDVAATLDRSEEACRQLATRARRKLRSRSAVEPDGVVSRPIVEEFLAAIATGDEQTALRCVHPDVELVSDGGADRHAARRPVVGASRVVRHLVNLAARMEPAWSVHPASVGGYPGVVVREADGTASILIAVEVEGGLVRAVRAVLNRDKLHGVDAASWPVR